MYAERPLAKRQAISPKLPFDSASLGREAHRVTAAALEAHRQHARNAHGGGRMSDRGSRNSDAWTHWSAVSMFSVRMDGVMLTPRSTSRYFNVAR
jgi:hypothetical protein